MFYRTAHYTAFIYPRENSLSLQITGSSGDVVFYNQLKDLDEAWEIMLQFDKNWWE